MGLFGLFKKKKQPEPAIKHAYPQEGGGWDYGSAEQAAGQQVALEPLTPIEQLRPEAMDRPTSFNEAEMQTVLSKLDLINSRLEMINQRLEHIERAFPQPVIETYQQRPPTQPARQW